MEFFIPVTKIKVKKTNKKNCMYQVKGEKLIIVSESANWFSYYGNQYGGPSKSKPNSTTPKHTPKELYNLL